MTPRGTLGLFYVYITQLMIHPTVYTLPFTLQLRYKPLDIMQGVAKSPKVHISSHNGFQNLITSTLLNIGPSVSQSGKRVAGIRPEY